MILLELDLSLWQAFLLYIVSSKLLILLPLSSILITLLTILSYHYYLSTAKATTQLETKTQELKIAQDILRDKKEELESYVESNIRLSQFAYVASHDLKSSLNTIKSFSGLLKATVEEHLGEKEKEYFNYIEKAAAESEALVIDTLYYAQVKAAPIQLKEVKVTEIITYLLISLKHLIDEKKAVVQIKELPETIVADKKQLLKVFEVLLTNALKFTLPHKTPIVHIWAEEQEMEWVFKISDNGIGIKQESQEKIFNEFIKLNSKYEYPGSGFGLAIGKNIIEKHGGRIWVVSSSQQGSIIAFSIKNEH